MPHAAHDPPQVPPPLPPPTHTYEELTAQAQQKEWTLFNKDYVDQHWTDFANSTAVRPASSLLRGTKASTHYLSDGQDHALQHQHQHELHVARRGSSMSTVTAPPPPHGNAEAMVDPCDKDDSRPSTYRCL
jgi:hypothetical protein